MSDEKTKNSPMMEEKDMENVELHRAESMVNETIDILDQINKNDKPPLEGNEAVYHYLGAKARTISFGLSQISAEVVMFFYMFSYVMRSSTTMNMFVDKVCLVHMSYSEDVCRNLVKYPDIKSQVEKVANNYHLGHSMLLFMPSAFLAIFIGSWSDKYGRKLPLICGLAGIILDGIGITFCAHFFYNRVEFAYIPALITGFSGGFIGALMVLYSYASDVTALGKRTLKYAFMELAFGASMPLGSLAGGYIFKYSGYVPVYVTSTCGHVLGLFWVIFFLEETKGLDNKDTWKQKFTNFWSFESLVSSFKTTMKKRPNKGRKQIGLLTLAMSIAVFSYAALSGILFLYVYHRYDWGNTTFSTVSSVYSIIGLALMMFIVPMSKRLNIGDPALGIAGSVSLVIKNILTGLAFKPWIFHLANIGGLLANLANLGARSRISKIVSKDDLGKVFAFISSAESIVPIVGSAVVSQVFNLTLDFFPGLIFVVIGVLGIVPLFVFIYIARLPSVNYEEMDNEEAQQENVQMKGEEVLPEKY